MTKKKKQKTREDHSNFLPFFEDIPKQLKTMPTSREHIL